MKYIFSAMLFIAGLTALHAQDCKAVLTGQVVDFHNGQPLINATVKVVGSQKVAYTDIDGNYSIPNLCNGAIEIEVSHPDCQEMVMPVNIQGNTTQKVYLEHHLEELGEVVLTEKAAQKALTGQEQTLTSEDLERYSSASIGDALKQVSGVSTLSTGNTIVKPVIQGLHSSRVLMLNNGVRMEDQEWGVEHAPNIDLNAAGKLTVIKGASALQYGGDAIGGVVIAEPERIPVKDTLYGKTIVSGSTNGRGGAVSSSLTKSYKNGWYAKLQGTFKKFGDFEGPDYMLSNTGTEEKDFSVTVGLNKFKYGFDAYYSYYHNNLGLLRASHIGSIADLIEAINSSEPYYIKEFSYAINAPRQEVTHQLARVKFYKRFEGLGKWNVQYDFQQNHRLEYDIRTGADRFKQAVDLTLTTHSLATNFKIDKHSAYEINVGMNGNYQVNFPDPETGVRRLIPDYKQYKFGAFATGNYHVTENLTAEAGLRYDFIHVDAQKYYQKARWNELHYNDDFSGIITKELGSQYLTNPVFNFHNVSFSTGIKYAFNQAYLVRLNYAMANRAPNPAELFSDGLHHSAAAIELGDLRISSEHSNKISATFEKQRGDFTFSIAPFYNPIHNFINLVPTGVEETIRSSFPVYNYQQIDACLMGVDVDLAYTITKNFSYQGKFAYVNGRNITEDKPLISMPPANITNTILYKNLHWHRLTLGVNAEYVFKQNEYPNYNFYQKVIQNDQYVEKLVKISNPPAAYVLMGFTANATFHPFKTGALQAGFTIDNLLNTDYRDYLNRLRYYAQNVGRNISLQLIFNY